MTRQTQPVDTPVIILGSHRSGTSAVTGLLARAGLRLGETLPAGADNPRGYFESPAVLAAHESLLASMERDWTCPPVRLQPEALDLQELKAAIEQVRADDGRWGAKDPRTMFLLPAWAALVSRMQFVGVVRDPGAVAASLQHRNRFDRDTALTLAHRYTGRLVRLHRALEFPVIVYGRDGAAFLDRVRDVAQGLGLAWDAAAAEKFFDQGLVHHTADDVGGDDFEELHAAGARPVDDVRIASAEQVQTVAIEVGDGDQELPLMVGPYADGRRTALWQRAIEARPDSASVIELVTPYVPATRPGVLTGKDSDLVATVSVGATGTVTAPAGATHIVAAGVLEEVAADAIPLLLRRLHEVTDADAVAVFDGLFRDGPGLPSVLRWPTLATTSRVSSRPFHHHHAQLESAAVSTAWYIAECRVADTGRGTLVLVKAASRLSPGPRHVGGEPERRRLEAALEEARRDEAALRQRLDETEAALRQRLDEAEAAITIERARHRRTVERLLHENAELRAIGVTPVPPQPVHHLVARVYNRLPRSSRSMLRMIPARWRRFFWRILGSPNT